MFPVGFIAGVATGAVAAVLAALLWRRAGAALARLRYVLAVGLLFAVAAGALYVAIGTRSARAPAAPQAAANSAPSGAAAAAVGGTPPARSMELEVSALAARLARQGGSDGDWTLLAQAYDFLGRPEDAQRARAHLASVALTPASEMSAATLAAAAGASGTVAAPPAAVQAAQSPADPADARAWLALAERRRTQHDYAGARAAYERLVELHAMSAQSWADYADVLGSLAGGSLTHEAATAIDNALRLDPNNSKALWLKASAALEAHQYTEALKFWQRLRAVLPAGSADVPIIDANIAEAESLAHGQGAPAPPADPARTAGPAQVSGTVSLDAHLRDRVPADTVLFIYAKAIDSPGPPLAVLRITPASWPVSFRLDDSQAMLPARRLSQFDQVIIEARISRTGQATPSAGDLYVRSEVVHPAASQKLALVINQEIG